MAWVAVAVLGGLGALARFAVDGLVSRRAGGGLPLGTLAVNLSGALLAGILHGAGVHGQALLLAGTAVLGSYTTFSIWMVESHRLGEDRGPGALLLNLALPLAGGLAAVVAGSALGALL